MRPAAACLALVLGPAAAGADIPPCLFEDDLRAAAMVLQIGDFTVTGPDAQGFCTVTGEVMRSFRNAPAVGTIVQTRIACSERALRPGDVEWTPPGPYSTATAIEFHIAAGGGPVRQGVGVFVLQEPTETPLWEVSPQCF
ncbi:MAG: hypothetical protein JJT81_05630 [Rubellimicrobium sp.]|nr:hypothetical protein [Rubellimicrobium sp.]